MENASCNFHKKSRQKYRSYEYLRCTQTNAEIKSRKLWKKILKRVFRLGMSWALRHRHVMKFRLNRALFDSYRFSDTSVVPLTRHVCELRAHTHARMHACMHACMRKMDKHSHRHAGVSLKQADTARSWASISLEQRWTTRDFPIRDNAITVNSAEDDANDHDMTFMCRRTYIEWRRYIVRNRYHWWHQVSGSDYPRKGESTVFYVLFWRFDDGCALLFPIAGYFDPDLLEFYIRRLSIYGIQLSYHCKKDFWKKSYNFSANRNRFENIYS